MRKILMSLFCVVAVMLFAVGCAKTSATAPTFVTQPTATFTETNVVLATATSTATVTVDLTTVLTPSTPTSTATEIAGIPTIVPTATPWTEVHVGVRITSVSGNPSNTANINLSCGTEVISNSGEPLPYQYQFSTQSNQYVALTVTAGTVGGVLQFDFYVSDTELLMPLTNNSVWLRVYTYQNDPGDPITSFFPLNNYY